MMIVNDDSRVINKLEASLTDDARVIIYNCHMFIVQATEHLKITLQNCSIWVIPKYNFAAMNTQQYNI